MGQSGIGHDAAKWHRTERSFADQLVAVAAGCKGVLESLRWRQSEVFEAQEPVPLAPDPVIVIDQIVAGGVEMAGVGAEGDPVADVVADQAPQ